MKYLMIVFLVCVAPVVGAQYWLGIENDTHLPIVSIEVHYGLDIQEVLDEPLPIGGTATHEGLVSGRGYQLVAWDTAGYMYTTPLEVPGHNTSGGILISISDFLVVKAPEPKEVGNGDSNNETCSTNNSSSWYVALLVLVVVGLLGYRRVTN